MEPGSSYDDDDPIAAGCPSHVTGIPGGTAGVAWCDAMFALCLVPREMLAVPPTCPAFWEWSPTPALP